MEDRGAVSTRLWDAIRDVLGHVGAATDRDTMLDACLDRLVEHLSADRGAIILSEPGAPAYVVNARAAGRALSEAEREELSRTVIREVMETGRPLAWQADADTPGPASAKTLGIALALAEPIFASPVRRARGAPGVRGVLYLDFRSVRRVLAGGTLRELAGAAAQLLSIVLDPLEELHVEREQTRALASRARADEGPGLAELLAPRSMTALRREVEAALAGTQPLLILGESGTGKTLLANALAHATGRQPVVRAMLGASDDLNTITSELFGHERGSFSGALTRRRGLVEYAAGGTLILDELLNLPLAAQRLLLDFTQFGTYRPLGHEGAEPRRADVRIVAVTNGDLDAAVQAGRFRQDLYYRLAGGVLVMPPLRERRADIAPLAEACLARGEPGASWHLSLEVRRMLAASALAWPGNLRQLENAILRARDRARASGAGTTGPAVIGPGHLDPRDLGVARLPDAVPAEPEAAPAAATGGLAERYQRLLAERARLDGAEAELYHEALAASGGVVAQVARELGVPRTSLTSRLATLGLGVRPRGS